jgi:hypothetical protein
MMIDMIDKKNMIRTAVLLGAGFWLVAGMAGAQERIAAPQVFGGSTMYRASTIMGGLLVAPVSASSSNGSEGALPNAPSALLEGGANAGAGTGGAAQNSRAIVAPIYTKYIPAGWTAQPLTAHDKVILGFRDTVSPFSFLSILVSAGYSQLTNGQPNYGTDRGAFGERLGAAALRDSTEGIFTDAVFAPMLHEDPRYYVEGNRYSFIHRVLYAVTRPIITRTDGGRETLNGALLLGYASASALSYTYYPSINQNFHDTAATFGGGIGATALGDVVSEFSDEVLIKLHVKKER